MSQNLRDELRALKLQLDSSLGKIDHLLSLALGDDQVEPAPAPIVPITAPVIQVATPKPVLVPAPVATSEFPWVLGVEVTCFGGRDDEASGEWKATAYGWYTCTPGSGMVDAFCALPFKVKRGDAVDFRDPATGRIVTILVGDGGPWNDAARPDQYLPKGDRPQAESGTDLRGRKTNGAGGDVTPAGWTMLNGKPARANYDNPPSGKFDLRWRPAEVAHEVTDHEMWETAPAIRRAALALVGVPFPYAPGTEDGELGCADVVSTALINAGVLAGNELELAVTGLDERLRTKHGWTAVQAPYRDGDVIIWGPRAGQTHGHVGILIVDGAKVTCVNNSSSKKAVIQMDLEGYDRPVVRVIRAPEVSK